MESTLQLHSLSFYQRRTYLLAALFVIGNLLFPQLFHLVPRGGLIWLPIYFFTLIGAYKYGRNVGLLTALLSPLANSLLFGMPMPAVLPAILLKSVLLALIAGYTAQRYRSASIFLFVGVVLGYQCLGGLGEWAMTGSWDAAWQDFRIGVPGMLLQVFGGYFFINYIIRKS